MQINSHHQPVERPKRRLFETKFSFGATSGIITSLGLIVGLDDWAHAKATIIGGILIIAIADNISDSMGIHVYQESECLRPREVWISTFTNFFTRFLVALSFILPIAIFPIAIAVVLSVIWGFLLLILLTCLISRDRKVSPWLAIFEHIGIATLVIILSSVAGKWVVGRF